ncbi:HET-domain-containing protein [Colletotrichum asianum]
MHGLILAASTSPVVPSFRKQLILCTPGTRPREYVLHTWRTCRQMTTFSEGILASGKAPGSKEAGPCIAPDEVIFFDSQWSMRTLGSKTTLSEIISSETGIPQNILNNKNMLHSASVAQKMSWASLRQTTRVEDEAYSLMGLFGVNMPTVYGEGKKAFR